MITLVKIAAVGLIGAIASLQIKKHSSDLAVLTAISAGIIILVFIADYLYGVVDYLKEFFSDTGTDASILKLIIKVIVVAYAVEFASSSVKDLGESSLSEKILLAGKIIILSFSLPVIKSVFDLIVSLIKGGL